MEWDKRWMEKNLPQQCQRFYRGAGANVIVSSSRLCCLLCSKCERMIKQKGLWNPGFR